MIVKNLHAYSEQNKVLLQNISFKADKSEIIVILGKSGAGKSTLLRAISSIGVKTTGTVSGVKKMGFLYQDGKESLSPAYSILSQAIEYIGDKAGAKKWFDKVGLSEQMHSYGDLLSGGQRMRASLAINMHLGGDVLLLDEPTANLDCDNKKIVTDILLSDVQKNKTTLLWVTHDIALARKIATRVLLVDKGKIIEDSSSVNFFKSPSTKIGKSLLKNIPLKSSKKLKAKSVCRVEKLCVGYDKKIILNNISFDIGQGQSLGIYGGSGVGKTTLMRVLTGQIAPTAGIMKIPDKVQMIFQDAKSALNPKLTIGVSIGEPLRNMKNQEEIKCRVKHCLEMVGIDPDCADRLPENFSGGELMRICIARAIVAKPNLILADEITASLDTVTAKKILNVLLKIQRETGVSILYVSHDREMLSQVTHKTLKITK